MPLVRGKNYKDCVSQNMHIEKKAHPKMDPKQRIAIVLSHCRKVYKMKEVKNELEVLEKEIKEIREDFSEKKKKWIE